MIYILRRRAVEKGRTSDMETIRVECSNVEALTYPYARYDQCGCGGPWTRARFFKGLPDDRHVITTPFPSHQSEWNRINSRTVPEFQLFLSTSHSSLLDLSRT